jgi:hypothetical protein
MFWFDLQKSLNQFRNNFLFSQQPDLISAQTFLATWLVSLEKILRWPSWPLAQPTKAAGLPLLSFPHWPSRTCGPSGPLPRLSPTSGHSRPLPPPTAFSATVTVVLSTEPTSSASRKSSRLCRLPSSNEAVLAHRLPFPYFISKTDDFNSLRSSLPICSPPSPAI